jgi:hypothetical protein
LAEDDSVRIRNHSPRMAIVMSAILPGLGQVYNEKIWKVPIIYAGEMTAIYYYNWNQKRYKKIIGILKDDGGAGQEEYEIYGRTLQSYNLEPARDHFRRQRDYSGLFIAGIYVLNIIDALVDAYFFEYDISDDLSLNIKPAFLTPDFSSGGIGLNLCLKF